MSWAFKDFHKRIALQAITILQEYSLVYLAMEERTNKSSVALYMAEQISMYKTILIVTTKRAIPGWQEHLTKLPLTKEYTLTNYEQVKNLRPEIFDLVLVDEAHNYSTYPKTSQRWKALKARIGKADIIYLSATPSAQTYSQLFHQFKLSYYSPWKLYSNFHTWYSYYGVPEQVYVQGRVIIKKVKTKEDLLWPEIQHLFISYTRAELGFEEAPEDNLVYLEPPALFKQAYNTLKNKRRIIINGEPIICETMSALRVKLHQLEGGTLKLENSNLFLKDTFKADWILAKYGDTSDLAIMYNYKAEKILLESKFKNALILQGTSYAEGVNLSHVRRLVVYSMDFKTSKYIQRRARQCSLDRVAPIIVDYILIKGAISDQVYKTVAVNKENYTNKYYVNTDL